MAERRIALVGRCADNTYMERIRVGDRVVVRANGALGTVIEITDGIYTVALEEPDPSGGLVWLGSAEALAVVLE